MNVRLCSRGVGIMKLRSDGANDAPDCRAVVTISVAVFGMKMSAGLGLGQQEYGCKAACQPPCKALVHPHPHHTALLYHAIKIDKAKAFTAQQLSSPSPVHAERVPINTCSMAHKTPSFATIMLQVSYIQPRTNYSCDPLRRKSLFYDSNAEYSFPSAQNSSGRVTLINSDPWRASGAAVNRWFESGPGNQFQNKGLADGKLGPFACRIGHRERIGKDHRGFPWSTVTPPPRRVWPVCRRGVRRRTGGRVPAGRPC